MRCSAIATIVWCWIAWWIVVVAVAAPPSPPKPNALSNSMDVNPNPICRLCPATRNHDAQNGIHAPISDLPSPTIHRSIPCWIEAVLDMRMAKAICGHMFHVRCLLRAPQDQQCPECQTSLRIADILPSANQGIPRVWEAVLRANTQQLEYLLANPLVNVNVRMTFIPGGTNGVRNSGFSPLHLAIRSGNLEAMRLLLAHPRIDPNLLAPSPTPGDPRRMMSPLAHAIRLDSVSVSVQMVRLLLEHPRIDVQVGNGPESPPLAIAFRLRRHEIMVLLLQHPRIHIEAELVREVAGSGQEQSFRLMAGKFTNQQRYFALVCALDAGQMDIARILVEAYGVPLILADNFGNSLMHRFAFAGSHDSLQVLRFLRHHHFPIDTMLLNHQQETPLHVAARDNNREAAQFLLDHYGMLQMWTMEDSIGRTPIWSALFARQYNLFVYLVERTGAVNQLASDTHCTFLHEIASRGNVELARFVVERGVDVDHSSESGQTALHHACEEGFVDMSRYLLSLGVDITKQDEEGLTPFVQAVESGSLDLIRMMVEEFGVDIRSPAIVPPSISLAVRAVLQQDERILKYLVERGVNVNEANASGWTALHDAATSLSVSRVDYLLSLPQIQCGLRDSEGYTALDWVTTRFGDTDALMGERENMMEIVLKLVRCMSHVPGILDELLFERLLRLPWTDEEEERIGTAWFVELLAYQTYPGEMAELQDDSVRYFLQYISRELPIVYERINTEDWKTVSAEFLAAWLRYMRSVQHVKSAVLARVYHVKGERAQNKAKQWHALNDAGFKRKPRQLEKQLRSPSLSDLAWFRTGKRRRFQEEHS